MDKLSQSSFHSAVSSFSKPANKVMVDGEFYDGEYVNKYIILNKVQGDKQVIVRQIQIYDQSLSTAQKRIYIFQFIARKQRNVFDINGQQTQVIGYGTFSEQANKHIGDSQFFEMDSIVPINIQVNVDKKDGNGYQIYQVPNDNASYIYYEIQTIYNFM